MKENNWDHLIGRRFAINKVVKSLTISGRVHNIPTYSLSAEDMAELRALAPVVRVWLPGTMGTMDVSPGRLNVHINAEGVVERVGYG